MLEEAKDVVEMKAWTLNGCKFTGAGIKMLEM